MSDGRDEPDARDSKGSQHASSISHASAPDDVSRLIARLRASASLRTPSKDAVGHQNALGSPIFMEKKDMEEVAEMGIVSPDLWESEGVEEQGLAERQLKLERQDIPSCFWHSCFMFLSLHSCGCVCFCFAGQCAVELIFSLVTTMTRKGMHTRKDYMRIDVQCSTPLIQRSNTPRIPVSVLGWSHYSCGVHTKPCKDNPTNRSSQ